MDTNVEDINRPAGQPSGASEAIEENEDDHETGASLQKRISKPSLKVIENKLVETENKLEVLWKRILKQVTKLQSPDQPAEEIRQGISEARSMFNAYQLEILALQEFTASTSSSEISQ